MPKKLLAGLLAFVLVLATVTPALAKPVEPDKADTASKLANTINGFEQATSVYAPEAKFKGVDDGVAILASSIEYTRYAGISRYDTAAKISADLRMWRMVGRNVIIATGSDYADALSASGLAGALYAPILLTPSTSASPEALKEIAALAPKNIYVVGGTGAVSDAVVKKFAAKAPGAKVKRLYGSSRYGTSFAIASETFRIRESMWGAPSVAFVASGSSFPDGLSLSAPAARGAIPVLLTETDVMNPYVKRFIQEYDIEEITIVGGTGVVSTGTQKAITKVGCDTVRLAGVNRYATSATVVRELSDAGVPIGPVGIASGENFPDGLAGGAAIGIWGGSLLLTTAKSLSPEAATVLKAHVGAVPFVEIYGGTGAVSKATEKSVRSILK